MAQLAFFDEALKHIDGGLRSLKPWPNGTSGTLQPMAPSSRSRSCDPPPIIRQRADLIAAVQLGNLQSDRLRIRAAAGEGQEMSLVRPDAIRHPIAVLRFQQTFARQPAIRDDVELTVLAGEHQHQSASCRAWRRDRGRRNTAALASWRYQPRRRHLPHRHVEKLSGCFAPLLRIRFLKLISAAGMRCACRARRFTSCE